MQQCRINRQSGFTLIEILISVVILAVGLMGLSVIQSQGLKDNQDAYLRSQAIFYIYDMSDRIRANANFWQVKDTAFPAKLNEINTNANDATPADHNFCSSDDLDTGGVPFRLLVDEADVLLPKCDEAQMAEYDLYRWRENISENLPNGTGEITREDDPNETGDKKILRLRIEWSRVGLDWKKVNDEIDKIPDPFIELDVSLDDPDE
jgi:prepilin-type N-terminal cleavage/methylation domain-containing protein